MRLYLFGAPRLERGSQLVQMDTRKALALLAVLALSGQEQQRDSLAALLYPEADTSSARAAFRRTLSTLHSALGEGILSIRREAVGLLQAAPLWVDVLEFKALLQRSNDLAALEEVAALYRDSFMAGFNLRDSPDFDEWQYQQQEDLRRQLDRALDQLVSHLTAQGDYQAALRAAERRVKLDPLVEEAHRQLMELYARADQRGAALRQYRECVRVLDQELGVSPLEATTQLYQQILSGKLTGSASPVPEKAGRSTAQVHSDRSQHSSFQKPPSLQNSPPAPKSPLFVGRKHEMSVLARVLSGSKTGGILIAVDGEAGVGKTRLAEEFLAQARQAGWTVAQASCYEGQSGLAYAPFLEALGNLLADSNHAARFANLPPAVLAEAGRLFPVLPGVTKEAVPAQLTEGPGAQARFFEALRQMTIAVLGGEVPGILFLDDLQWADSSTLDLLTYLARRIQPTGCLILAAWRGEQGPNSEHLSQLLNELQRAGSLLHLSLSRMKPAEINELAQSFGATLSPGLVERLYQESEGLPLIALEYLNAPDPSRPDWKLPGGVRALLHLRLQAPGEMARQLLAAAAVIGRSFDFETLQAISGRSEWETIAGLEELVRLGLIREQGGSGYDFSHEKLRSVAYEETSMARRRLLHQRAGETFASTASGAREASARAGLAANHFLQAGQTARAAEYFQQAGDHARQLHANGEALASYQAALAAGHPNPAALHEASGDLYMLRGEYGAAVASYQAAAAFCTPGCLSNLMHKLGEVYHRRGEWDAAEGHYRAALEAGEVDQGHAWQAHLFADWSLTAYRAAQTDRAQELAEKSLEMAQTGDDPAALSQALNMMGILARARGELEQAGDFFERSLESAGSLAGGVADSVANNLDHVALRCAALHNLARLEQERGKPQDAIPLAQKALEYCLLLDDRHHQAALLNTLSDLNHAAGQEAEAMVYLKQAVALFAEIDDEVGLDRPEIWKLTEW